MLNPTRFGEHPLEDIFQPMSFKTLHAYFDAKSMSIAARTHLSLPLKLDELKEQLIHTNQLLSALLEQKEHNDALKTHLNHALILLEAIHNNQEKVRGVEYTSELIEGHLDSINNLIENSPEEERQEWTERVHQLRNPTAGRMLKDGISKLFSPTTWLYRKFTPTALKQRINGLVPTTDSEAMSLLKRFVLSHVFVLTGTEEIDPTSPQLQGELGESNHIIEDLSNQLAENDNTMAKQFVHITRNDLKKIQTTHNKMIELIGDFKVQSQRTIRNQANLQEIMDLEVKLDDFMTQNDSFFIRLSLFLSKICTIFKSSTARKVEKVESMKAALESSKTYYKTAIESDKINMAQHRKGILQEFEETLQTSFQKEEITLVTPKPSTNPIKYYPLETLFESVKKKEKQSIDEADSSPVPLRS